MQQERLKLDTGKDFLTPQYPGGLLPPEPVKNRQCWTREQRPSCSDRRSSPGLGGQGAHRQAIHSQKELEVNSLKFRPLSTRTSVGLQHGYKIQRHKLCHKYWSLLATLSDRNLADAPLHLITITVASAGAGGERKAAGSCPPALPALSEDRSEQTVHRTAWPPRPAQWFGVSWWSVSVCVCVCDFGGGWGAHSLVSDVGSGSHFGGVSSGRTQGSLEASCRSEWGVREEAGWGPGWALGEEKGPSGKSGTSEAPGLKDRGVGEGTGSNLHVIQNPRYRRARSEMLGTRSFPAPLPRNDS